MKEVKMFTCEFCGAKNGTKYDILKHENICTYNPKHRTCDSCGFLRDKSIYICEHGVELYRAKKNCKLWMSESGVKKLDMLEDKIRLEENKLYPIKEK